MTGNTEFSIHLNLASYQPRVVVFPHLHAAAVFVCFVCAVTGHLAAARFEGYVL